MVVVPQVMFTVADVSGLLALRELWRHMRMGICD